MNCGARIWLQWSLVLAAIAPIGCSSRVAEPVTAETASIDAIEELKQPFRESGSVQEPVAASNAVPDLNVQLAELRSKVAGREGWTVATSPVGQTLYRKRVPTDGLVLAFAQDFTSPFCKTTQRLMKPVVGLIRDASAGTGDAEAVIDGWQVSVGVSRLAEEPGQSLVVVQLMASH